MTKTQRPQIRPCVVLFVEILGLENYLTTMEPDEYAELIQTIFNQLDETIEIYDGHINQHKENIIMALFGVPVAHEDDPERAIRSALLMAKRIEDLKANSNISVQLRIGMNLGRVCAGEIGATGKFSFTVMGDVVNTAARIMENGTAGQILITEDIYSNTRTVFEFSNPFKLTIKDTGKDLTVYNVLRMRSGLIKRRGIEGLQSPLIGRDQEYKLLRETIEQIVHKRKGSIVLINGEAGVGKSRLIEEVFTYSLRLSLEEAKIVNWFTGRCSPYKEQVYSPIVEIIKQICNIESTDSEDRLINKLQTAVKKIMNGKADEAYPYLAQLFNIKLESNQEVMVKYLRPKDLKLQTQISASLFLKNYAASVPTVYCIDDLHFADETTLELLNFFLQTPPELPGLIILISRVDKDKPYWSLQENLKKELDLIEINLARLDPNATREITRNLLKIPNLAESLIDEIVSRSEGNPFFLEEIIKLLISRGILYRQGNQWFARSVKTDISIPYTIEGIIRSRLDTLSDDLREILSEMAVLGRNFSLRLLKKFTSRWEEFDRLIVQLRENGFISSNNDEDYSFNHGLLRDVIYSSIPKNILKELHLKVAETIETLYKDRLNEFNEVLFEHFSKTDNFEKAIDYAFKAGENAQTKYANTAAIFYYLWIIDELNRQGGNHSLKRIALENLGKVYSIIGQNDDALMVYNQALSLSEEPKQRAKIYAAIAHTYERISDYEKATDYYQNALSLLSEPDVALQLETMIGLAWVKYLKGEFSSSQEVLENGLKLTLDRSGIDMRKVQARIYNILGSIHARIGREEESFDYYNKSLKLYELIDDLTGIGVVYNNIHGHFSKKGDFYRALEYLKKSLSIAQKIGDLLSQAITTYNIGLLYYELNDLEKAEAEYRKYLNINEKINNHLGNGYGNMGLGLIEKERGNYDLAERYLSTAQEIFERLGSKILKATTELHIARVKLEKGDFDTALKICDQIWIKAERFNNLSLLVNCKIFKAETRIAQALSAESKKSDYLEEARELLIDIINKVENYSLSIDTQFEIYFNLSRILLLQGKKAEAIKNYEQASLLQNEILKFITDEKVRTRFLEQRIYRQYADFRKELGI